jgi:hypothetical protein
MPAFGRLYHPDPQDHNFLARNRPLGVSEMRAYRYWNAEGWWGDQGSVPQCVAYASVHWLEDGPITHAGPVPIIQPQMLYDAAQAIDPWAGTPHEGTTVRAAAKILQRLGLIASYHWAFTLDDVVYTVLNHGPVIMGTDWYEGMSDPDAKGVLHATGANQGGHAWVINGVNVPARMFRMKNSWGRGWNRHGFGLIGFDDIKQLVENNGEACLAVEAKTA